MRRFSPRKDIETLLIAGADANAGTIVQDIDRQTRSTGAQSERHRAITRSLRGATITRRPPRIAWTNRARRSSYSPRQCACAAILAMTPTKKPDQTHRSSNGFHRAQLRRRLSYRSGKRLIAKTMAAATMMSRTQPIAVETKTSQHRSLQVPRREGDLSPITPSQPLRARHPRIHCRGAQCVSLMNVGRISTQRVHHVAVV